MAVVKNFWLRDNTQKLGGAVIYQSKGQTLMRQLAPSISNPRTDAQMEQRVKLANLVAFYRASASWMRGAFETKPNNQSDYNAFVSANAAGNAVWLTKSQVDAGNAIVAPYVVSRGTLGEVVQTQNTNAITTNIYVGDLTIGANTTIAQFTAALLNNNNGLQEGDQVSLIQYIQNTATDGNYTITCREYEVVLSLSSTELLGSYMPVDMLEATSGDNPALQVATSSYVGGVAIVLSRTQSGRILVSSSVVTLTSNNTVYAAMTTTTQQNAAIRSYGSTTTVFLDSTLADTANSSVATALQILQVLGPADQNIASGGTLPLLDDGDSIRVLLSEPIDMADYDGARIQYTGENDYFVLSASPSTGETSTLTLTAQESTDREGNYAIDTGYIEVTIGDNTLRWSITTGRGTGLG